MPIQRIHVENFKSFSELDIKLSRFHVLIGSNAAGKSNFISIFKFLRDITRHGIVNAIADHHPGRLSGRMIIEMINAYLGPVSSDQLSGGCDGKMYLHFSRDMYITLRPANLFRIYRRTGVFTATDDWHFPVYRASEQHFSKE